MARVPKTFANVRRMDGDWVLVDNPNYRGKPRILKPACHPELGPCVDVQCRCGGQMHIHEAQVAGVPLDAEVACACESCGEPLVFPPGWFAKAFAQMRRDGWID